MTSLALALDNALTTATELPGGGHDIGDPYAVQRELVGLRLARGETIAGVKLGLTSKAKMQQMGVDSVIWGRLTDAMRIEDGGVLDLAPRIHPKVEPEVAFLVRGGAIAAVAPALEVIDSRWLDFKFTLAEVIADNTSAAGFVVGEWQPVPDNLDSLGVQLIIDGEVAETGSTAAILGDPREAFAEALRLAGTLEDGWVVLAGAATAAVRVGPGQTVRVEVESLGSASLKASS
ncbi:2-oxo-3-hexenedioate decarboxylase [Paractinoplanes brasiliensis]|uniref:2-oxo-3-hexenedioate decarboxylase n=1 Tax=Paractinoplanes brasiliensis TaxID=52695 RepID=A0A4R6JED1_9ACTN|nr:fumarylacetoacetate hydrolase family protein [Actinoplanes brasiliensis]TDO32915.1 2-oxo-3-hexenedioate decarboxylase [Actinoplanes brasiliensis]GID28631.1 4-oxalocrotonate decarboxylase [Actinoplanes brasiliensis]